MRDSRVHNYPPRWNAAPNQELLVIRRNRKTGEVSLDPLRWGLIPSWRSHPTGGRKPINAKCEMVRDRATFRDAYQREGKTALCICHEGRQSIRDSRNLGELERTGFRRMDSDFCSDYDRCQ